MKIRTRLPLTAASVGEHVRTLAVTGDPLSPADEAAYRRWALDPDGGPCPVPLALLYPGGPVPEEPDAALGAAVAEQLFVSAIAEGQAGPNPHAASGTED